MKEQEPKSIKESAQKDRRGFLKTAGMALLAGAALPQAAQASISHVGSDIRDGTSNTFTGGVVSNSDLGLVLNVYLAIEPDGTGLGTLSDPVHSTINSHLAVQQTTRHGNELEFVGVVIRSNDPVRLGQRFAVTSYVQGDFTSLVLQLDHETFDGQGFHVDSMMLRID